MGAPKDLVAVMRRLTAGWTQAEVAETLGELCAVMLSDRGVGFVLVTGATGADGSGHMTAETNCAERWMAARLLTFAVERYQGPASGEPARGAS